MRGLAAFLGVALCTAVCAGLPYGGMPRIAVARDGRSFAAALRGFAVGKALLVEEIFPLCAIAHELEPFQAQATHEVSGWLGFFRPFARPIGRLAKGRGAGSTPATGILWIADGAVRDPNTISLGSSRVSTC